MATVECIYQRQATQEDLTPGMDQPLKVITLFDGKGRGMFTSKWIGSGPLDSPTQEARVDTFINAYGRGGHGERRVNKCANRKVATSGGTVICGVPCASDCTEHKY
jgi:hypothetical protein